MKILVLGVTGLLGCQVYDILSQYFEVIGTARNLPDNFFLPKDKIILDTDAFDLEKIETLIKENYINWVINCIGIVPRMCKNYNHAVYINSVFPHKLEEICHKHNSKLAHISTDCIYNGKHGDYYEVTYPNAADFYGLSKIIGEPKNSLVIRTSIIGHEFRNKTGLLEWVLNSPRIIHGYPKVFWTGLTARELAINLCKMIEKNMCGVYNVVSDKISKFDLIEKIINVYGLKKTLIIDTSMKSKKTLITTKIKSVGFNLDKPFDIMLQEMKDGWKP